MNTNAAPSPLLSVLRTAEITARLIAAAAVLVATCALVHYTIETAKDDRAAIHALQVSE